MREREERFRRDHRWAPSHMSDYLDGGLAAASRARMDHHIGECAQCRRVLAELRRIVDGLHSLATPSEGVDAVRIAAAVRARSTELG